MSCLTLKLPKCEKTPTFFLIHWGDKKQQNFMLSCKSVEIVIKKIHLQKRLHLFKIILAQHKIERIYGLLVFLKQIFCPFWETLKLTTPKMVQNTEKNHGQTFATA